MRAPPSRLRVFEGVAALEPAVEAAHLRLLPGWTAHDMPSGLVRKPLFPTVPGHEDPSAVQRTPVITSDHRPPISRRSGPHSGSSRRLGA